MAEVFIIGQILKAINFQEPHIYCKWSIQAGQSWRIIEGDGVGQTPIAYNRYENTSIFCTPLDLHLGTCSIQGWPKFHIEVYAVNVFNKHWPIGYGFVHIPPRPGLHRLEIRTWKIAPRSWYDALRVRFGGGGLALCTEDLIYTGLDRYKLHTTTSGIIEVEVNLIFRNFTKYGVEFI